MKIDDEINSGTSKGAKFLDNVFEETLEKWAEEIDSDRSDLDSDNDSESSDHESEIKAGNEGIEIPDSNAIHTSYLYGKNRFES